jgi:3-oxoacyl-[acyl-carrier-protein] synthase-3
LAAVHAYLPAQSFPVRECLAAYGFPDKQIRLHERFYGFSQIRLDPDGDLTELLTSAVSGMPELRGRKHQVRYVLHARTMPVVAPYPLNPLHDATIRLGLGHATAFSVTQHACASGLLAVELAGNLLAGDGDPDALALIIAGEKAFTASAQVIAGTGVMGEGAAAVLVRGHGSRDRVLAYAVDTHGQFSAGPWMSEKVSAEFREAYPGLLAEVIRTAVERAGLTVDDLALIMPHNVNRISWLRTLRQLGIHDTDRLLLDAFPDMGHCFGADSFIGYDIARRQGRLRPGDRYLMTAVGLGATFAAMVLVH